MRIPVQPNNQRRPAPAGWQSEHRGNLQLEGGVELDLSVHRSSQPCSPYLTRVSLKSADHTKATDSTSFVRSPRRKLPPEIHTSPHSNVGIVGYVIHGRSDVDETPNVPGATLKLCRR